MRGSWWGQTRRLWRERLRPFWLEVRWPLLGLAWLLALGLGYQGFAAYYAHVGEARGPMDLLYLALQLFTLESGAVWGPAVGWELEAARYLAPAVAAWTLLQAAWAIFAEQLQMARLRFYQSHVVVCGLGQTGWLIAQALLAQGERVVGIEQHAESGLARQCRDLGAIVLAGDATSPDLLRRARIGWARHLIAVCGDDAVNAEVALQARGLVANRRRGTLTCTVHVVEPRLWNLLRRQELDPDGGAGLRLEFLNVFDAGARICLAEHPPFDDVAGDQAAPPWLLVVGVGRFGESLVVHAARRWRDRCGASARRPRITLVDRGAERKRELLRLRYPKLEQLCDLDVYQADVYSPEFQRGAFLFDALGQCHAKVAYVCLDDDATALAAALALLNATDGCDLPIVVRLRQEDGLARLLRQGDQGDSGFGRLRAFPLLDRTCTGSLLDGTHETLARLIHEAYVRDQRQQGESPATNPAMVPWDELSDDLQESNRRQADHVGAKLRAIGRRLVPTLDWEVPVLELTPDEVEILARLEHERFLDERRTAGWMYAPGRKDLKKKTSPYLLPWGELAEEVRDYDRAAVRAMPVFLAQAGFRVEGVRRV